MEFYVAFTKCPDTWTGDVFGPHTKGSLMVVLDTGHGVFFTASIVTGYFEELKLSLTPASLVEFNASYDLLRLVVTSEEGDRILRTCRGCVLSRKRFNLRDLILKYVPFREPVELPLFETHSLNDTQSVILILRECLDLDNPVSVLVRGLHSRLASASSLFDTLLALLPRCSLVAVVR